MPRRVIVPAGAGAPANPLSAGIASGGFVFVSGQTAAEKMGLDAQTRAVLEKVGDVLRAAGTSYAQVVRCGVYLTDATAFAAMNAVYREFFPTDPPARSTIICALADPRILIEIDCVATVS